MSLSQKFLSVFNPLTESHVLWLKKMMDVAGNMHPEKNSDLINEINLNPMGLKIKPQDALDWPHVHFVLSATYARAVLSDRAFIPVPESPGAEPRKTP